MVLVPLDPFQGMGRGGILQCNLIHFGGWEGRDGSSATGSISGEGKREMVPVPLDALQGMGREGILQCNWIHFGDGKRGNIRCDWMLFRGLEEREVAVPADT